MSPISVIETPLFQRLLSRTPFSEYELLVLIATASSRYKTYFIDKRGGRGKREISQPTKEIKYLQRLLVKHELNTLPIHDAAVGYRPNKSILDHAQPHAASRYLLKLDFTDFFTSLKFAAIEHRLSQDTNYTYIERWILGHLLCRRIKRTGITQLTIGAPSSPYVSNYLLWEFDSLLSEYCAVRGVRYTRYADDLAFSTSEPRVLDDVQNKVRQNIKDLGYLGLTLNESKTVNVSTKRRRTLVGLTLSNEGAASIGRDEKRILRAMMHRLSAGTLNSTEISYLRGRMAFTHAIDPHYVKKLLDRYGLATIESIAAK